MCLALLVILLHCSSLKAREVFTINKVEIQADPSLQVPNGDALTILCAADISKSGNFMIEHHFTFFKDGRILSDTTSLQNRTEYKIPAARFADTGEYVCMVKAKEKKKKSEVILVKVTGLPKPKLTALKNMVTEGEELVLKCEVPEEAPPLTFTFQKLLTPGGPVTRTKKELEKNVTTIEILVEPGEKILRFQCIASVYSAHGMQESAPSDVELVTVVEPFSTPALVIEPSLNVTEGDNVKLVCRVVVRNYDIEIIIQKDKVILNSTRGQNTLTYFTKVSMQDNGNYTCKVELGSVSKEKTVNMVVTELFSKPELIHSAKMIDEGDQLQLQCQVKGLLPVTKISIKTRYLGKDNLLNDSSSFITRAHVNNTATYICTAEINGIIKESDPVKINVYAPVSIPQLWIVSGVRDVTLGRTIRFQCQSTYGTPPITYKFFRGNKTVNSSQIFNKLPAEFKDKPTEVGVEQYSCEASNHHSHIRKRSRELNITVIAPVGKVNLISVPEREVEDGKGISFHCYVETGSLPINFKLLKQNNRKPIYEDTEMDTKVTWYKATWSRQDSGEYFCEASNPTNTVRQSDTISINVILASWQKVLIALFVLIIIVILGCGGCCWYLWKKRKAKHSSIEMSGSAGVTNSSGVKLESRQNSDGQYYPGYMADSENHMKATDENKGPEHEITEVEYTEVEVSTPDPHRAPVQKGTEPVYSEIRKAKNDSGENRYSKIGSCPDAT